MTTRVTLYCVTISDKHCICDFFLQVKISTPPAQVTNESRRKKEDNLAAVFMGFIIVFLVCHLPRLLLNIHELATIR